MWPFKIRIRDFSAAKKLSQNNNKFSESSSLKSVSFEEISLGNIFETFSKFVRCQYIFI